jgi:hypothetical protein
MSSPRTVPANSAAPTTSHVPSTSEELVALTNTRHYLSWSSIIEYLNASAIFMGIARGVNLFATGPFQYLFLPIAVGANLVKAALHLRAARLEKSLQGERKYGTMAKLALELTTAAAITIAIIGGAASQVAFALATPLLIISAIATKMLMDIYETGFHLLQVLKFKKSPDDLSQAQAADHLNSAKSHALNALTSATAAGGLALVVFSGFGILGVSLATAATIVGAVSSAYFKGLRAPATLVNVAPVASFAATTTLEDTSSTAHTASLLQTNARNVAYGAHTEAFARKEAFTNNSSSRTVAYPTQTKAPVMQQVSDDQLYTSHRPA